MDKVNELKKIIVDLRMDLIKEQIPKGHCPYTYYTALAKYMKNCTMDCDKCRERFMITMKKRIEKEVERL